MGQQDPLDALVTELQIQTNEPEPDEAPDLNEQIDQAMEMCSGMSFATEDPLGIGGLLSAVARATELVATRSCNHLEQLGALFAQLLVEAHQSLAFFEPTFQPDQPAQGRLAFRELGLAIGISAIERAEGLIPQGHPVRDTYGAILEHRRTADAIRTFWTDPAHRENPTWTDHEDINTVMLATSLAPDGYLGL
jgi:hypothetical protein